MDKLDLDKIKKNKQTKKELGLPLTAHIEIDQTEQIEKLEAVNKSIESLWELINDRKEFDFNLLVNQIKYLHERLDFTPIISGLEKLNTSQNSSLNKQLDIKDFSKLLKAVEDNKPVPIDLSSLEKAVIEVQQRIQDSIVEPSQAPDDYQPVRRVVKVGNKLVYDDQPTSSRGGGGGSGETSLLVNSAPVSASNPVPVDIQDASIAIDLQQGAGAVTATTLRAVQANNAGKTIISAGGSASSSGNNTLVAAGTNKLKVHAFSLTTISTTAITCIFQSGAGGTELWRVVLQAPSGASAGANLSVALPGYLFATASTTLLNLSLSSANTVHWSCSYIDEA